MLLLPSTPGNSSLKKSYLGKLMRLYNARRVNISVLAGFDGVVVKNLVLVLVCVVRKIEAGGVKRKEAASPAQLHPAERRLSVASTIKILRQPYSRVPEPQSYKQANDSVKSCPGSPFKMESKTVPGIKS